ncbi:MAG: hypothetical protein A2W11_12195, partial [Ignavibacteria bacterium RBG_16_35_7]
MLIFRQNKIELCKIFQVQIFITSLFLHCTLSESSNCTFRIENGVTYVENKGNLNFDEKKITVVPTLKIVMNESVGGEIVASVRDVAVDNHNNIYVADNANSRIVVFDSTGNYKQAFGRKGKGPGEFSSINSMDFSEEGLLYVLDRQLRRISIFDSTGSCINSFTCRQMCMDFAVKDAKEIFITLFPIAAKEGIVAIYDSSGKEIRSFIEKSETISKVAMTGELGGVTYFNNTIYYVHPYPYRIEQYSRDGILSRAILFERQGQKGIEDVLSTSFNISVLRTNLNSIYILQKDMLLTHVT